MTMIGNCILCICVIACFPLVYLLLVCVAIVAIMLKSSNLFENTYSQRYNKMSLALLKAVNTCFKMLPNGFYIGKL